MTRPKSCAGSETPVTLYIGVESSLPNQTPVTSSAVKPMNQASRKSWLVPVLPAAARPGCAALPVPQTTAAAIMLPIDRTSVGLGKGVSVRFELGVRRIIKKKTEEYVIDIICTYYT